jgi:hypothetical protein
LLFVASVINRGESYERFSDLWFHDYYLWVVLVSDGYLWI